MTNTVPQHLRDHLATLTPEQRRRVTEHLARWPQSELDGLGVAAGLPTEHDYDVDEIDGDLPAELSGTLYRNGAGRWDHDGRQFHHLFDGDGMLSAFTVTGGRVHFRNRYVRTRHYLNRRMLGLRLNRNFGTAAPGGWRANVGRMIPNLANTAVVEHAGHLYALWEGGPPTEIDPDTLETVGLTRFGGTLRPLGSFSAHPSVCPSTGELFNFGVEPVPRPHLRVYRADRGGHVSRFRSIPLPYPAMVHDFAITERYLVFVIDPLIINPLPIALGRKTFADSMRYRPDHGSRFVLVPRDGGPIRTIEHDALLHFHISNAYDDRGDVVLDLITYTDGAMLDNIAMFREYGQSEPSRLSRFRVTERGRIEGSVLSERACEFPRHHPGYEGRDHRYVHVCTRHRSIAGYDAITRIDTRTGAEDSHVAGTPGNSFCEPVFVPRPGAADEDDGWVLSVEYLADRHRSRLVVLDGRDIGAGPVATAELRHHLPQGFHGAFRRVDRGAAQASNGVAR